MAFDLISRPEDQKDQTNISDKEILIIFDVMIWFTHPTVMKFISEVYFLTGSRKNRFYTLIDDFFISFYSTAERYN